MPGLVSFSVFGTDPEDIYYPGALENARLYQEHYPDASCVFYLGDEALPLSDKLNKFSNVEIFHMKDYPEDQSATFWRFRATKDFPGKDWYAFRDVDGRLGLREKTAMDEWLDSEYQFHVMRDHPRHGIEMLAGLWGVKGPGIVRIAGRTPDYISGDFYQVDQQWLQKIAWRWAKASLIEHVDCRWKYRSFGATYGFSYPRTDDIFFVGEAHNGDGTIRFPAHRAEVILDRRSDIYEGWHVPLQDPAKVYNSGTRGDVRHASPA